MFALQDMPLPILTQRQRVADPQRRPERQSLPGDPAPNAQQDDDSPAKRRRTAEDELMQELIDEIDVDEAHCDNGLFELTLDHELPITERTMQFALVQRLSSVMLVGRAARKDQAPRSTSC